MNFDKTDKFAPTSQKYALHPQTCKVTWNLRLGTRHENLCKSLFLCLPVVGGGRVGGTSERSCSCVNHVGPYAAFLRSTRASEIDRQPSLASQQRGQRESKVTAKDLPQSVMGCGGRGSARRGGECGGLMCHATAVPLRTLSHKHVFTAAKHHLNYL